MMHHPTDNFDYASAVVRRPRAATISFSPFAPIEPEFAAAEESRLGTLAWLATVVDTDVEAANFLTELSHKEITKDALDSPRIEKKRKDIDGSGELVNVMHVLQYKLNNRTDEHDDLDLDLYDEEESDEADEGEDEEEVTSGSGGRTRSNSLSDLDFVSSLGRNGRRSRANSFSFSPGDGPRDGFIGAYSPEERKRRIERFLQKRSSRVWSKKVKYDVRKNFADSRIRIKGRFIRKEEEQVIFTEDVKPRPHPQAANAKAPRSNSRFNTLPLPTISFTSMGVPVGGKSAVGKSGGLCTRSRSMSLDEVSLASAAVSLPALVPAPAPARMAHRFPSRSSPYSSSHTHKAARTVV